MSESTALTPMIRQYRQIKAQHPHDLLLFRIGDFYETFGDDAKEVSEILNIVLTRKHVGQGKTLPLAGIPYHALDNYLGRLIRAGRRVVICEQVEDPATAKGVVRREVTRIVTPGSVIEPGMLEDKAANYLVCVVRGKRAWGLAYAELSTGALAACEFASETVERDHIKVPGSLIAEIERIAPSEILASEEDWMILESALREAFGVGRSILKTRIDRGMTRLESARRTLLDHFGVATLQGFGVEDVGGTLSSIGAICAAGGVIAYLCETQRRSLSHIQKLKLYSLNTAMMLDATTQRSLELTRNLIDGGRSATLLSVLDHTKTPMGGRLLREWIMQPLQDVASITARLDAVEQAFKNASLRFQLEEGLRQVRDIERILGRVHLGNANARDLVALGVSLHALPDIRTALLRLIHLANEERKSAGLFESIVHALPEFDELTQMIESTLQPDPPVSIREGGFIRDGVDTKLDELRAVSHDGKGWITKMRAQEIERTGISSLKIGYNKVFGYYLEVSNAHLGKVPEHYIRRQTLTNGERFVTEALKEREALILGAQDAIQSLEQELFDQLCERIRQVTPKLQLLASLIAQLDVLISFTQSAIQCGWVRPEVHANDTLEIIAGRHPIIEAMADRPFVPNNVQLDSAQQIWLITGPNMAGKSTFIRQVALITLMAHLGSFIPARSASIGVVDRIFTRVGATDYLSKGQSTFLVEMTETANILHHATDKSLVILDEIGRGTSTYDGLSIAWSVIEYLHPSEKQGPKTLFATHYHELTELEGTLSRLRNYNVAVKEEADEITFLYHIAQGCADRSYGIYAAQLAGMPQQTIDRAKMILHQLESHHAPSGNYRQNEPLQPQASQPQALQPDDIDVMQLNLFSADVPQVFLDLKTLDVMRLTPIEAMRQLDQLVHLAKITWP